MLSEHDPMELVGHTSIEELESHIGSVYEMYTEELSGMLGAVLGLTLPSLGAAGLALVQALALLRSGENVEAVRLVLTLDVSLIVVSVVSL